ncbi:YaaL family protein [Fredinandcohnia quinoae]|uniref:YaaL family protein n=1 Tax=Fredinandcohnia quinoae TaxID=2918902 RepID=A0AAW5EDP8_9BACI|nr:YaaL family protein [Fredinandcohnia sp. SECRCQ15]MCH1627850.1 YaaL family protein [Fredinandcohnia sp. SECRCQ15]
MLFKRKGWLRNEFNEKLLHQLQLTKQEWMKQKSLIEKSFEPSDDILNELKVAETKYFFLLREAKKRKVNL